MVHAARKEDRSFYEPHPRHLFWAYNFETPCTFSSQKCTLQLVDNKSIWSPKTV